jgi:hypothetical protein
MANHNKLAAVLTALASLGTLLFIITGFAMNASQYLYGWFTVHVSGVYAFFGWFEFVILMFGWASVACIYMRRRYRLAVTGAFLIWISIPMEFLGITAFGLLDPISGVQGAIHMSYIPFFVLTVFLPQFIFSSVGLYFLADSKDQFVN